MAENLTSARHMAYLEAGKEQAARLYRDMETDEYAAMDRIINNKDYIDIVDLIPLELAPQCEQLLKGFERLMPHTRQLARLLIGYILEQGGWRYSEQQCCLRAGAPPHAFRNLRTTWARFTSFLNLLIWHSMQGAVGRVDLAATEAAVQGTHQDRRLFYERAGFIKQKDKNEGAATIIFVNDNIHRPHSQVRVLEAERSELALPSGADLAELTAERSEPTPPGGSSDET